MEMDLAVQAMLLALTKWELTILENNLQLCGSLEIMLWMINLLDKLNSI
jgi:hypothetical protein